MSNQTLVFVGSVTRETRYFETAKGRGLSTLILDEDTGQLTHASVMSGIDNPTFLSLDPKRDMLYATSEVYGWNEGTVTAYQFDRRDGTLAYVNKQPTLGSIAAHSSLDRSGRYLFVANYAHEQWGGSYGEDIPGQAVAVLPIDARGSLGAAVSSVAHEGSGPIPGRQGEPHPHCAVASPDNRFLLATDLGIDKVLTYRFEDGRLTRPAENNFLALPPGSGPRHLVFAGDGRSVYLINELGSTVGHLRYDPESGRLELLQLISTLPDGFTGSSRCADLHLSADGRFLYGSNRGHDSIVIFSVDPSKGSLTLVGHQPCGGRTPRNFGLSPSQRYLLVANQNTHTIATFRRDAATGGLEQVGSFDIGTPMVLTMIERS